MPYDFNGEKCSVLPGPTGTGTPKRERPKTNFKVFNKSSELGTKENEMMAMESYKDRRLT